MNPNQSRRSKIRLNKFIAQSGIASRRKADELIAAGRVEVNGSVLTEMGRQINPAIDRVEVDGVPIKPPEEKIYLVLNKPAGYTTTKKDRFAKKTVYELIPAQYRDLVHPAGRLDKDTTGLLIFTSDGELTEKLTHPRYNCEKEYLVVARGWVTSGELERLRRGVKLMEGKTRPAKIDLICQSEEKTELRLVIKQGWKRIIRRMFKKIGHEVLKLERTRIGKIKIENLPLGHWKNISRDDII